MENIAIYVAFFLGGVVFGGWLSAFRFMILAVVVTVVYFIGLAISMPSLGASLGKVVLAFVSIQLGYVVGVGVSSLVKTPLRKATGRLQVGPLDTSKKTLK